MTLPIRVRRALGISSGHSLAVSVFAVIERLGIQSAFAFDKHFAQFGLCLYV
jgi:hypothetical protein